MPAGFTSPVIKSCNTSLLTQLEHVALVGFSQGAIMALVAIASGRWPVGAVVAYSGRLASPQPFTPAGSPRVLAVHGGADPVIPAANSTETATALRNLGLDARSHILPGVRHTITTQGAQLGAAFVAEALASRLG